MTYAVGFHFPVSLCLHLQESELYWHTNDFENQDKDMYLSNIVDAVVFVTLGNKV